MFPFFSIFSENIFLAWSRVFLGLNEKKGKEGNELYFSMKSIKLELSGGSRLI